MSEAAIPLLDPRVQRLCAGRLHEPHAFLGPQRDAGGRPVVRVFDPLARAAWIETCDGWRQAAAAGPAGLFLVHAETPRPYRVRFEGEGGALREAFDPYCFAPAISDHDLYLFNAGQLTEAWRTLGAHPLAVEGVAGTRFAVWAPNAERVSVVGEFNRWDGRAHPMTVRGASGVWELFLPGIAPGALYKFEIRNGDTGTIHLKADPYARAGELRPGTASRVAAPSAHAWRDADWMARRARSDWLGAPLAIYEVHAGSWRRCADGSLPGWRALGDELIAYATDLGFTHVELLPITEHPLDESWGYQTTGYFAPAARYGGADELREFVDRCHAAGLGAILDWVPGHFPTDAWALARFDGSALYEHEDARLGLHPDWGTHTFNFGRNEARAFLLASARYWLSEFHFDGLRVDAVASMLYLDYSRAPGQWLPNRYGGRENLEAIDFLRQLNVLLHAEFPGALTIAEESTAWPMVSRPTYVGGLGFSMKWNMGWMHDTLQYIRRDPVHRRFHHDELTFGQLYAYTENFVLPFSHDEVVHGKGSLIAKMPGDAWQQFANLRLLFAYQMTYPGKKLNFMGNEFAHGAEWHEGRALDWELLDTPLHRGVQRCFRDLQRLYVAEPALHQLDFAPQGFAWIDCHDADSSVISYVRRARDGAFFVVVLNFTPQPRPAYRIGVPQVGPYRELLNTDSTHYGGSNTGNGGLLHAQGTPWMGQPASLELTLPPLAGLIVAPA
ncbi:MAG: 1,4-alpha-glucan branching enzyme [Betaproteobacteria bacterium RIFCSPLOWO2_12_FULL_67_28]|nr:MAG: 1,4-alpha-glucan branching enzyme [Betaproteobacteria bacterium RIFCSPLOWO2_12_FULL_67_28]